MNITISPSKLSGTIVAPPSKSYSHRFLICASLFSKATVIKNISFATDVLTTMDCLKELGADFEVNDNNFCLKNFCQKDNIILNCRESGSTLRFLLPICSALGIKAKFMGSNRLLDRPNEKFIESLNKYGANISNFEVNGKLKGNDFYVDGSLSSQYVSGYLMALACLKQESYLHITGKKVSQKYIDITIDVLLSFGIKVVKVGDGYKIFKQKSFPKKEIVIEGDYSGASFFLVAGAINGEIEIKGLKQDSLQGDKEIINILSKFGANIFFKNNSLLVKSNKLNGCEIDCENFPDLAQIIAVLGCFSNGTTIIKGISRLKIKESDRYKAIIDMLERLNAKYESFDNYIKIYSVDENRDGFFLRDKDHRTVMSQTILACFLSSDSIIYDAECVEKSYPNFYNDFKSLGGKIDVCI